VIRGSDEIRDAYRSDSVAKAYIAERFRQPLGAALHARQAAALLRVIREAKPDRILELAPGPARLTVDVIRAFTGQLVMVDNSMQMLREARKRLGSQTGWRTAQADAFALPFRSEFDMVYSFRLIRHFDVAERAALYRQIAQVLKPNGLLVFDAVNRMVSEPLRARAAPGEYQHFDALLEPDQLHQELREAGFHVDSLEGVQHSFGALQRVQVLIAPRAPRLARQLIAAIDRLGRGEPLEWIVVCRRR
jgi:ubiquinone/menaquinone biosynthesis C-methylase UbiE